MTRTERIRELLDEYARQRRQNETDQRRREQDAFARDPQIEALRAQSISLALESMRAAMGEADENKRRDIAADMRKRGLYINGEIRRRLRALGLPEDYLEERYRCPACRDTGYVGDAPARFCACFEKRLAAMGAERGPDGQTFETFRETIAPEEDGQRDQLAGARKMLEAFADAFPDTPYQMIVLMGAGGLGKSFLLNCVYERVTRREFAALRVTAFRMFEAMRKRHISAEADADEFSAMLETPLLLIDDLGTEPMMRNITVEYLFMLVNERVESGKKTFITTNLTYEQLQERYGERITSRLFDRSRGRAINLKGRDLRLYGIR